MVASTKTLAQVETEPNYDRLSELKAFDDTKTGVKGLVNAGITVVPKIFLHHPPENSPKPPPPTTHFKFPVIDLAGATADPGPRLVEVGEVGEAAEAWGFFQVVNHGVEERVMEEMMRGVRTFSELDGEERKKWYTRDLIERLRIVVILICLMGLRPIGGTLYFVGWLLGLPIPRIYHHLAG